MFVYNNESYFYVRDILGNILGIIDKDGNYLIKYSYSAFRVPTVEYTDNSIVSTHNPFLFKGYYYDEKGLYWLSSRYYDPEIGRFISPDSVDYHNPTSINGLNFYAYCNNDPVNYCDPSGHLVFWIAAIIVGACVGAGYALYKDWQDGGIDGSIGAVG